ncbi:hypothetical protein SLEP1_g57001 [Rubroshorea leprosula]|uniref:Uncharacterized protein n=1 Tax=Rubroshorea leprosula TaxID=152421 RepID=A0AAV5MJW8_9ROSI|nr:hypothetical protein SLEP1_g57001 [Rubroshorea leprosula]
MAELVLNFVSPIIEIAVPKAISFSAAQISTAWGLEKELGELAQKLTMIQGLLQDAEKRQESDPAIRSWLQHLTDVAYDAVDVLDEYEYEVLKHKVQTQGRKWKQVRTFFGVFNSTAFRLSMADKIRKINETLDKINNPLVLLLPIRLSGQSDSTAGARQYLETDSIPDCFKFVGRHNDVLDIVNKLDNIRSQHILSGISIVGFGGIGKTTLAKSICSMVKEQKLYDLVAWVCVSEEFDEKIILGDILQPHSNLKSLTIDGYKGKMFPSWMGNDINGFGSSFLLDNMVELQLSDCNECTCIPSLGLLPFLKVLHINRMDNVRRMGHKLQPGGAESIRLFPALKTLSVYGMKRLEEWVEVVEDAAAGSQGVIVFPCLEDVQIHGCPLLETWSMGGFSSHHKLSMLQIQWCEKLMAIPSLDGLSTLKRFGLEGNNGLTSLPIGLGSSISLQFLQIESCRNLNTIPTMNGLTSLDYLRLSRCDGLTCLPIGLDSCISLQKLKIQFCPNLIFISDDIKKLRSLSILEIAFCENLRSLPEEWLDSLTRLKKLRFGPFWSELEEFPGLTSIHQFHPSLEVLFLYGWDKLKSLPHQLRHLTDLKELS